MCGNYMYHSKQRSGVNSDSECPAGVSVLPDDVAPVPPCSSPSLLLVLD